MPLASLFWQILRLNEIQQQQTDVQSNRYKLKKKKLTINKQIIS